MSFEPPSFTPQLLRLAQSRASRGVVDARQLAPPTALRRKVRNLPFPGLFRKPRMVTGANATPEGRCFELFTEDNTKPGSFGRLLGADPFVRPQRLRPDRLSMWLTTNYRTPARGGPSIAYVESVDRDRNHPGMLFTGVDRGKGTTHILELSQADGPPRADMEGIETFTVTFVESEPPSLWRLPRPPLWLGYYMGSPDGRYLDSDKTGKTSQIFLATSHDTEGQRGWVKHPMSRRLPEAVIWPSFVYEQPGEYLHPATNTVVWGGGCEEPSVYWDGVLFWMWYIGAHPVPNLPGPPRRETKIGLALSYNGVDWWKPVIASSPVPGTNVVLEGGSDPRIHWDHWSVNMCHVVPDWFVGGFHMFYGGVGAPGSMFVQSIGHAYSADGFKWVKNPNNPILRPGNHGTWDSIFVRSPSPILMRKSNGFPTWKLYYWGEGKQLGPNPDPGGIGLAEA